LHYVVLSTIVLRKRALMRVFKNKPFDRWAKNGGLTDSRLLEAVDEIEQGLVDADLGGNVVKKRVAFGSRGKSGGLRTLLAFRKGDKAFFIYGFAKNVRATIKPDELKGLKQLAKAYFGLDAGALSKALTSGALIEVERR